MAEKCIQCGQGGKKGLIGQDGNFRCWRHRQDSEARAERLARNERRLANRAAAREQVRQGKIKADDTAAGRAKAADGLIGEDAEGDPNKPAAEYVMDGMDLNKATDRVTVCQKVAAQVDAGHMFRASADAIINAVKIAAAQDTTAGVGDGVTINFVMIDSRREAEELLAGDHGPTHVNDIEPVVTE